MAISFVNKSAFASGTAGLTVGAVASVVANDLILLFVESANQAIALPTGYTEITSSPVSTGTAAAAGGVRLSVFYRIATGADTTTTVADSGDHTTAIKIAYRGVDTNTPFDATPVSGIKTPASTSTVFPAITTATNNALVVLSSALDLDAASTATTGAATNANLTTITERHDQTVTSGFGGGLVIIDGTKATAGATGTTTATVTSTVQVYLTIALREKPVTGSLSVTETGTETFAGAGTVLVEGFLASTETGTDIFSASGTVGSAEITGTFAVTETGTDTFASTGNVIVEGSLAVSEVGSDTFTSSGKVIVSGSFAVTEAANDSFVSTGNVLVQGAFTSTETGSDTFASSGSVGNVVASGALDVAETGDDTFASVGAIPISGSFSTNETGNDVFVAAADVFILGSASIVEVENDAFAAIGTVVPYTVGSMAATEEADQLGNYTVDGYVVDGYTKTGWEGLVLVDGSLNTTEIGVDGFSATGSEVVQEESTGGSYSRTVINATAKVVSVRAIAYAGRPTPKGFTVVNGIANPFSTESQSQISPISASGILGIDDESLLMLLVA